MSYVNFPSMVPMDFSYYRSSVHRENISLPTLEIEGLLKREDYATIVEDKKHFRAAFLYLCKEVLPVVNYDGSSLRIGDNNIRQKVYDSIEVLRGIFTSLIHSQDSEIVFFPSESNGNVILTLSFDGIIGFPGWHGKPIEPINASIFHNHIRPCLPVFSEAMGFEFETSELKIKTIKCRDEEPKWREEVHELLHFGKKPIE